MCLQPYGPPTTICNRYNRWASRGIGQRLFEGIAGAGPVPDELSIDSTHVKPVLSLSKGRIDRRPGSKGLC